MVARLRQHLVYYVLDLGLNNVVRERSDPLDDVANYLITGGRLPDGSCLNDSQCLPNPKECMSNLYNARVMSVTVETYARARCTECFAMSTDAVPSPGDGPGGIIVCSDNFMTFKNVDQSDIRIPIPRRKGDLSDPERGSIVVTHASLKTKQFTFFLVQTDQGDLFKVTLQYSDQPDDVSVCFSSPPPPERKIWMGCVVRPRGSSICLDVLPTLCPINFSGGGGEGGVLLECSCNKYSWLVLLRV
jgi:hypothetical protein